MKWWLASAVLVALIAGSAAPSAAKKAKPKGELGSEWVNAKGNSRSAQMGLYLRSERGVVPGVYRPVQFDWPAGDLQKGKYPGNIAKDEEDEVGLRVTIGLDGTVTACEITKPAEIEAFNIHACPHVLRYGRFVPALSDQGQRLSRSYDAIASYELVPRITMLAEQQPLPVSPVKKAQPVTLPTLATAGITAETQRPPDVSYIAATIGVDADGKATGCTLHAPTEEDALDKQICDSLKKNLVIRPAVNLQTNAPVEDSITVSLYWK